MLKEENLHLHTEVNIYYKFLIFFFVCPKIVVYAMELGWRARTIAFAYLKLEGE